MDKKAQLGLIEFKFLMIGLIIGLILGIAVIYLSTKGVLPLGFIKTMFCPAAG